MIRKRTELLTKLQYGEHYNLSRPTVDRWIERGILAAEQVHNRIFINTLKTVLAGNTKKSLSRIIVRDDLRLRKTMVSLSQSQIDIRIKTGAMDIEIINGEEYIVLEKNEIIKFKPR